MTIGGGPKRNKAGTSSTVELGLAGVASHLRESVSIPGKVAGGLRQMILTGQLRPGERIVEWKIARQLSIGQPTAREALMMLETEGLVQRHPNRGCAVTQLSLKEIDQIYAVRAELEPLAAELAVRNSADLERRNLAVAMERLKNSAQAGDFEEWHLRDLEFHQTLWQLAGNPFLEKALAQISVPFFAFAELVFLDSKPRDLVAQASQHARITDAILAGDPQNARQVTRQVLEEFWRRWTARAEASATETATAE